MVVNNFYGFHIFYVILSWELKEILINKFPPIEIIYLINVRFLYQLTFFIWLDLSQNWVLLNILFPIQLKIYGLSIVYRFADLLKTK